METTSVLPVILIALLFVAVLAFGVWMYRWQYVRADALLEAWLRGQGHAAARRSAGPNPTGTGPGHRHASDKRVVYRVVVVDGSGRRRSGVVRLGRRTTGTLADDVTAEWDASR